MRVAAPLLYGIYWLDFLDRWDPKSPWHDRRVRLAASLAIDRNAINEAEMLGLGKPAGAFVPPQFDFALPVEPPPFDPKRAKQLLTEAGYPNGFDAGDLTPLPPYTSLVEAVGNFLGAVGVRTRVRTMERAPFMSNWHDKKLRGHHGEPSSPFERRARRASRQRLDWTGDRSPLGVGGSSEPCPERVTATGEPCWRGQPNAAPCAGTHAESASAQTDVHAS